MKIILSRNELLAALLFASNDEARFTLNSVCVEVNAGARPILIATDGRRMAVIESQAEQIEEFVGSFQMLLLADFVRPICALSRAFGGKIFPWIQFENSPGSERVAVTFIGGHGFFEAEKTALVQGAFPKWREWVPDKSAARTQINDLAINAAYVGDFVRAGKSLGAKTTAIQMNLVGKESAIEVKIPGVEYFYALVMPCKVDETVDYQPEFLGIVKDLPVKEKAAAENGEQKETKGTEPEKESGISSITISGGGESVTITSKEAKAIRETCDKLLKADSSPASESGCDEDEDLIQQCIEVIRREGKASVALLQRRLRIGYTRAARIMDELEARAIVGPSKGAEPRDILIDLNREVPA